MANFSLTLILPFSYTLIVSTNSIKISLKIMRYKQSIYQDWKDGELTHKDYRQMKEAYEGQTGAINEEKCIKEGDKGNI